MSGLPLKCLSVVLLLTAALAGVAPATEGAIGETVKDLSFKDIRFLTRSLDDLPKSKAYVLAFVSTSCPLAKRYLPVLNRLEQTYRARGVQFLALHPGADDSIPTLAASAVEADAEFPFVRDEGGRCARRLGVTRTPQVAVLDAERRLRYRGRIDDQYRIGGGRPAPTRRDLVEALDALLTGKPVAVAETPVDGCLITPPELPAAKTPVTFAEVAPILRKHCVECHRPDTAAPFSLRTYEEASARGNAVAEAVADHRMPPWFASPADTEFVNRRGLTVREREVIQQWVKGGKPRGDEAKLPPPSEGERWRIGRPDLIVKGPQQDLPAEGVVDYQYAVLPHVFLHDTWIQAAQILPDNPRVLHHCNMAWLRLGEKFQMSNFVGSSRVDLQACKLEYSIVSPK